MVLLLVLVFTSEAAVESVVCLRLVVDADGGDGNGSSAVRGEDDSEDEDGEDDGCTLGEGGEGDAVGWLVGSESFADSNGCERADNRYNSSSSYLHSMLLYIC